LSDERNSQSLWKPKKKRKKVDQPGNTEERFFKGANLTQPTLISATANAFPIQARGL
jgi:hypothetical protein